MVARPAAEAYRLTMLRRAAHVGGLALALWLVSGAPAGAAELDGGCAGAGVSLDGDGNELDTASAPGDGGTSGDPFRVDYDGTVAYEGTTPGAFHNHSWHVEVFGITVKDGGSPNGNDEAATAGDADVSDYLPFDAPGLYYVSGGIDADEGACDGNAWVKIVGSPVGTIPWIAGVVSTAAGAAVLAWTWWGR
jgi:hypothetical protein